MKRRQFLISATTAAIAAAWTRVAGVVRVVKPPPSVPLPDVGTVFDHIFRDLNRGRISSASFQRVRSEAYAILGRVRTGSIDRATAAGRMRAIHAEALRDPEPQHVIDPLRPDEVGVEEVVALLRRAIAGDAAIEVERAWKDVHHTYADFTIDGWHLVGYRRGYGIKYVDNVICPDGRTGTFSSFELREGNPVDLLENDEQDRLDDIIETAQVQS